MREYGQTSEYWLDEKTYAEGMLILDYRSTILENIRIELEKDSNKKSIFDQYLE